MAIFNWFSHSFVTLHGQAGVTTVLGTYYVNFWLTPGRIVSQLPPIICMPRQVLIHRQSPSSFLIHFPHPPHSVPSKSAFWNYKGRKEGKGRKIDDVRVALMGKVAPPNMEPLVMWRLWHHGMNEREGGRERGISNGISWKEFLCPVRNWIESTWRLHVITTKHTHTHTKSVWDSLLDYGGLEWQRILTDLENTHWMLFMRTFLIKRIMTMFGVS